MNHDNHDIHPIPSYPVTLIANISLASDNVEIDIDRQVSQRSTVQCSACVLRLTRRPCVELVARLLKCSSDIFES